MWLTEGEGGGSVRLAASERDSAGSYSVLEVTPPVAGSALLVRRAHGLIARESMKQIS